MLPRDGCSTTTLSLRLLLVGLDDSRIVLGGNLFSSRPGTRLGVAEHKDDNSRVFEFKLTPEDKGDIDDILARSNSKNLIGLMGDSGAEYR